MIKNIYIQLSAEIVNLLLQEDMRAYNMEGAMMRKKGNFLSLVVPGLAERRPSLVHGDHIFAKLPDADYTTAPYQVIYTKYFLCDKVLMIFSLNKTQVLGNN